MSFTTWTYILNLKKHKARPEDIDKFHASENVFFPPLLAFNILFQDAAAESQAKLS